MKNIFIFDHFFIVNSSYKNVDDINLIKNSAEKIIFESNEYYISSNENLKFSLSDYNIYLSTSWCIPELDILPAVRWFEYRALMDGYKVSNSNTKKFFNSCIKEKNRDNTIVQNVYLIEDSLFDKIKNSGVNIINSFALVIPKLFKMENSWCLISEIAFNKEKNYTVYVGYGQSVSSVTYVKGIEALKSVMHHSRDCLRQSLKKDVNDLKFYSLVDLSGEINDVDIKYLNNNGDIGIIDSVISKKIDVDPKVIIKKNTGAYKSECNRILIFVIFLLLFVTGYLLFQNCNLRHKSVVIDDNIESLINSNKSYFNNIKNDFKHIKKDFFDSSKICAVDNEIKKFNNSNVNEHGSISTDDEFDNIFTDFDKDFSHTSKVFKTVNTMKNLSNNPYSCFSKIEFIIPKNLEIISYGYNASIINGNRKENLVLIVKSNKNVVQNFVNNISNYCKNLKIESINENSNGILTIKMCNN